MNALQFANQFSQLISAPNGVKDVRRLILQLAIQGRLVEQRFDEEHSAHLINNLRDIREKQGGTKRGLRFESVSDNESFYDVPNTWAWVRLGELGDIVGGGTPSSTTPEYFDENGIPWLTPADLYNLSGKYVSKGRRGLSELGLKNSSARILPHSTVLFSSRAPIGYVAIAANPLATNQGFKSCVPFLPEMSVYIYYYLMAVTDQIEQNATGTTFKEVSGKVVEQIPVALPPLKEQKRIIAKVDELMALCDQIETQQMAVTKLSWDSMVTSLDVLSTSKSLSEVSAAWNRVQLNFPTFFSTSDSVKSLRQLVYDMACTGRLSQRLDDATTASDILVNLDRTQKDLIKSVQKLAPIAPDEEPTELPSTWKWIRLGEVCRSIEYGTSQKADDDTTGIPVLRMGNIIDGKIDFENLKYVDATIKELPQLFLKKGDLIFNRTNSYELVGKMGLFDAEDNKYTFASYLIRLSLFDEYVMPEWINLFFQSRICRKTQIEPNITVQTNQANFNGTKLANVMIPLAPLEEQRDIVHQVDYYLSLCSTLEKLLNDLNETQNKLSFVTTQTMLDSGSIFNSPSEENKKYRRIVNIEIQLMSSMIKDISTTILAKILQQHGGKMDAKELWKASKLIEIDDFYALLKREIDDGFIQEPTVAELKLVEVADAYQAVANT